jgi:ATP-dependent Clp protease ATP-binding subunit ClpA
MAGDSGRGGDDVFEKFGVDIRTAVVLGVEEAKALNATQVRPEHLLIGLVLQGEGPAAGMLAAHGLDEATARRLAHDRAGTDLDGEALAAIGIDVERVRASVEQTFGRGALDRIRFRPRRFHLPFDSAAKAALRDSLVHAKQERRNRLDGTHLLRALLDADDPGVLDLLQRAEIDPEELRREARRRPRGAA